MALFGLLNILVFALLQSGARSFGITMSRSTLQGELSRALARLQGEVRRSSASLVSVSRDPARFNRDGVSLCGLRDWRASASYSPEGSPLWDEYLVYYATTESPGRLLRRVDHPAGAPYTRPLPSFAMPDNPAGSDSSVLAQHVEEFKLAYDGGSSSLGVSLLLRRRAGLTPEGRRVNEERVQAHCRLHLNNP